MAAPLAGMPMQTLLEVGRHSWAGQDFHRQGVQQYCRAVMGCCEEDTLSPKTRRLHKRIAEGIRLPGQKAMENFAAAYEGRLRVSPAHRGIVYLVVPEGCKLPEGKARHISEQMLSSPSKLILELEAAAELVMEAGEGAYVGSTVAAAAAAAPDPYASLLAGRVQAKYRKIARPSMREMPRRRSRILLTCHTPAGCAELPIRLGEQYVINHCGVEMLANDAPLVYLSKLKPYLEQCACIEGLRGQS